MLHGTAEQCIACEPYHRDTSLLMVHYSYYYRYSSAGRRGTGYPRDCCARQGRRRRQPTVSLAA